MVELNEVEFVTALAEGLSQVSEEDSLICEAVKATSDNELLEGMVTKCMKDWIKANLTYEEIQDIRKHIRIPNKTTVETYNVINESRKVRRESENIMEEADKLLKYESPNPYEPMSEWFHKFNRQKMADELVEEI